MFFTKNINRTTFYSFIMIVVSSFLVITGIHFLAERSVNLGNSRNQIRVRTCEVEKQFNECITDITAVSINKTLLTCACKTSTGQTKVYKVLR